MNNGSNESRTAQAPAKTETFASRHVKLITFLVCISVFLILFGWIFVLEAHDYLAGLFFESREEMMLIDVVRFSEQNGVVYAEQLEEYACEVHEDGNYIRFSADIETCYSFYAVADKGTGRVTSFLLTDRDREKTVNVLTDDVLAFLNEKEQ